jgi:hypothetical protein
VTNEGDRFPSSSDCIEERSKCYASSLIMAGLPLLLFLWGFSVLFFSGWAGVALNQKKKKKKKKKKPVFGDCGSFTVVVVAFLGFCILFFFLSGSALP